jgi:ligand-binding sensor protein
MISIKNLVKAQFGLTNPNPRATKTYAYLMFGSAPSGLVATWVISKNKGEKMELTELLPLKKWVEFEKEIHKKFGLDVNVFNDQGIRITDYKKWVNKLCPAIKATDKGQSFICAVAHMNLSGQAMKTRKPVIEECDAGLLKLVVPIFVGDEFLGAIGACGVLLDDGEVDAFLVNKSTDITEEEVESLSVGIPAVTTDNALEMTEYIQDQINNIVETFQSRS